MHFEFAYLFFFLDSFGIKTTSTLSILKILSAGLSVSYMLHLAETLKKKRIGLKR